MIAGRKDLDLEEVATKGLEAIYELMTEFVSQKRAADWGKINEGCLALEKLRRESAIFKSMLKSGAVEPGHS